MTPKQNAEAIEAALKYAEGLYGNEYKHNALKAANEAASEENK
ncbi:hypothetical protein CPT_Phriendly_026 [Vibrio phage Phriendly]|nr:hypothetical protein CPT_Phriendly_026 [Vibrio phage Phriendly]